MAEQLTFYQDNPEYEAFLKKFEPKKTTDDCFTPPEVYEAIKGWVCREYNVEESRIVRPFWPGEDYETFRYPEGCVVLDNPPFSILSQICDFYLTKGIEFFLFAPSLTIFSGRKNTPRCNHIICDSSIIYENGAVVRTSFITSFGKGFVAQTAPELTKIINNEVDKARKLVTKPLPKYEYPWNVVTAAMLQKYAKYGIEFVIRQNDCVPVSALDEQKKVGKTIFGGGLLVSDEKAAEREAAEREAAERAIAQKIETIEKKTWKLSKREKEIVMGLKSCRTMSDDNA